MARSRGTVRIECPSCGETFEAETPDGGVRIDPVDCPECGETCSAPSVDGQVVLGFRPKTPIEKGLLATTAAMAGIVLFFFFVPWLTLTVPGVRIHQSGLDAALGGYSWEPRQDAWPPKDVESHVASELARGSVEEGRSPSWWHSPQPLLLLVPLGSVAAGVLCLLSLKGHARARLFPFIASAADFVALAILAITIMTGLGADSALKETLSGSPWREHLAQDMGVNKHFGLIASLLLLIAGVVGSSSSILLAQKRTKPPPGARRRRRRASTARPTEARRDEGHKARRKTERPRPRRRDDPREE